MTPWRLRFAAHLGLRSTATPLFLHSAGSADPVEQIRYAADLGLAGVSDNALTSRSIQDQERIGNELAKRGMALSSFVSNMAADNKTLWGNREPQWRERIRAEILESIAVARRVNCRVISVVSGIAGGMDRASQIAGMIENLRDIAEIAERSEMLLALEHVNEKRVPGFLLRRLEETLHIIERVGSPAIKVMFDSHHVTAMDGDVVSHFRRARQHVPVVQIADYPDRAEPGTGEVDFPAFFRELLASGFSGMVELEFMPAAPGADGEQAALAALQHINAGLAPTN